MLYFTAAFDLLSGLGVLRFNDLRRALDGISQRVLTATLRGLERDGLAKAPRAGVAGASSVDGARSAPEPKG